MAPMGSYRAYRVEMPDGVARGGVRLLEAAELPPGDVTVRVSWSSLNYKDALSARGRPGVTREYPHTPGIDAAGTVLDSNDNRFQAGDPVIVTSYGLGVEIPGGFGELIRVPGDWVLPLPPGLSLRDSMVLGTAGLTAALALIALQHYGIEPAHGPALVTGASGGVGSLAVTLLADRGFEVIASSGSRGAWEWLRELGAAKVIDRNELATPSERPLLRGTYAAMIDSVGDHTLANGIKSLLPGGAAVACGLVQGPELPLNVFPFIIRGAALLGVDSAYLPREQRLRAWHRLAAEWRPRRLESWGREVGLDGLDEAIDEILAGRTVGRVVVKVSEE